MPLGSIPSTTPPKKNSKKEIIKRSYPVSLDEEGGYYLPFPAEEIERRLFSEIQGHQT